MLERNLQSSYRGVIAAFAKSVALCLIVIFSLQQGPAQTPLNTWRSAGPNAAIVTVIVDPFDPNIIYAGGFSGVFKSIDNGASWLPLKLERATDLSVDNTNSNTIYAANNGVYKSTDGGLNWTNLNSPAASKVQVSPSDPNYIVAADFDFRIFLTNNSGVSWETRPSPPAFEYGDAFEIDPQDPNNIYAAYVAGDIIHLQRSNNAASTWTVFYYPCLFSGCPPGALLTSVTSTFKSDPNDSSNVYALACNAIGCSVWSLFKSTNGGASWTERGSIQASTMAISPQGPGMIYVGTIFPDPGRVFRSLDDGASWFAFNAGLSNAEIYDLAFDRSGTFLHAATAAGVYSVRLRSTAFPVSVSGRVTTPTGSGLRNAVVYLVDQQGTQRSATTSTFGFYSFTDVPDGQSYTISVASRRYRFAPRVVEVHSNLTDIDLLGME